MHSHDGPPFFFIFSIKQQTLISRILKHMHLFLTLKITHFLTNQFKEEKFSYPTLKFNCYCYNIKYHNFLLAIITILLN